MLSEIDDDTFHYYAGLNIYVRLDRLEPKEKSNIFLLRVSHHDDEIKSKANAEHNSECDSPFSPSIVAANDSDGAEEKINNIDASPFLTKEEAAKTYLIHNSIDLSNYYTKSQVDALIKNQQIINNSSSADEINNKFSTNFLESIAASNVESWFDNYIYSVSDRFNSDISCGTRFTINDGVYNAQWIVVGADTEIGKGDVQLAKPHLSLIPATNLGKAVMNDVYITAGAYANSKMNTKTIPAIVKALQSVLGDHLLARRVKLANSVGSSNYKSNSSAYYTVYANLMCVRQIYGNHGYENGYDIGDDIAALPGFKNYKDKICGFSGFWLRSVYNDGIFVIARGDGTIEVNGANASYGIRPLITIG